MKRALSVAVAAAVLLALSAVSLALSAERFSLGDAVPITGLLVACGFLLALARRRRRAWARKGPLASCCNAHTL